ncbi:hypothetical protein OG453_07105 [Streptomyces sp. NBC_01381]|uniref:hypothetical protein n=1 Tax=Streptomyces sp. NBC_01381 TaxID=2903845 RepID=UPI00224FF75A|nr:hypothetical protein [Streptomyces sp. NBC_01381]MCX4666436.1 hypothetical protein [Streptomyces sp. NBC_01381]
MVIDDPRLMRFEELLDRAGALLHGGSPKAAFDAAHDALQVLPADGTLSREEHDEWLLRGWVMYMRAQDAHGCVQQALTPECESKPAEAAWRGGFVRWRHALVWRAAALVGVLLAGIAFLLVGASVVASAPSAHRASVSTAVAAGTVALLAVQALAVWMFAKAARRPMTTS